MKIAVILPVGKSDYLANTVLDGLIDLGDEDNKLSFITTRNYPSPFDLKKYEKSEEDFVQYAKSADMIILLWGKNSTNFALAEKINIWDKTIFIDGSELGKNNRFDLNIRRAVLDGTYGGIGAINTNMLTKCKLYFRREKPYIKGITPLPFGIERRYRSFYTQEKNRDIDFTCIFGQEEYPILRKRAKEFIEVFCKKNNFTYYTKKTKGFNFDDNSKIAGRNEFYDILSRTKVGVSIGGGGFDTARFWEILGSGAILLTEKIDIFDEDDNSLDYKRIIQFYDLEDFKIKVKDLALNRLGRYSDDRAELEKEYQKVIDNHSTKARVRTILKKFYEK